MRRFLLLISLPVFAYGQTITLDTLKIKEGVRFSDTGKDIATSATPVRVGYIDTTRTARVKFTGVTNNNTNPGTMNWDSTQRAFKGWQYVVQRSFDMSWNFLVDSVYVSGTASETNLDTVEVEANYPAVGKYITTAWHGSYNATAGGSKTFIFRIRKDGVQLDSVTVTTAAGGSSSEALDVENILLFKTVGASGTVHSKTKVISENGVKINSGVTYSVATTSVSRFILSVQISDATAGNNFKLEQGYSTARN